MYVVANNALSAQASGHLVIVNLGADIIAVDALRTDRVAEALLWRQDAVDDPQNNPNAQRVSRRRFAAATRSSATAT